MKIRNIGIMAHVDAGKTTTTERILYYTGKSHKIGDVDFGNTITDWMTQEQERGITITSASITCFWRNYQINIIDTPGHVDFTAEVERSLRVLNGGIVVFSAVEGVQAQTETVWRQASKYNIPRIVYINKMDRLGADFFKVVCDIKNKFEMIPVVLQIPILEKNNFKGVVDLIKMKEINFRMINGKPEIKYEKIRQELELEAKDFREKLIDTLSGFSDEILELYFKNQEISSDLLNTEIRKNTNNLNIVPVLMGTSLNNIGIEPLIDSVVDYFPSPLEINFDAFNIKTGVKIKINPNEEKKLAALVFKIQYLPSIASYIYFIRVYSGELNFSKKIVNISKNKREKFTRIFRVFSNKNEQINSLSEGDIGAIIGLKFSSTGDTLAEEGNDILLENMTFPEPVISVAIEPERASDEIKLKEILSIIEREDPTFSFREIKETGQILVSGMGKLHLDIITTRIKDDFNLKIYTGKPQVSYRETINKSIKESFEFNNIFEGKQLNLRIDIILNPLKRGEGNKIKFEISIDPLFELAIKKGIKSSLSCGVAGYPIIDVEIKILSLTYEKNKTSEFALETISALAFQSIFKKADPIKLEPIMNLEIKTPIEFTGEVISSLNSIGGMVRMISNIGDFELIRAEAAFEKLFDYASNLRSSTKGKGFFTMEFSYFKEKN